MSIERFSGATAVVLSAVAVWLYACVGDDPELNGAFANDGGVEATNDAAGGPDSAGGDSGCGDTQTSEANCGLCGRACKTGVGCFAGRCGNAVVDLSTGNDAVCTVLANGRVYCWGDNSTKQVGDPTGVNHDTAFQIVSDSLGNAFDHVVQVSVGEKHACARKDDGTIWCWGQGSERQLGEGESGTTAAPTRVPNLSGYKWVSAGGYFTCAIDGSNVVWCWGGNAYGALGHKEGDSNDQPCNVPEKEEDAGGSCNAVPKMVGDGRGVTYHAETVATGRAHACLLTPQSHNVKCWGLSDASQLGPEGPDAGGRFDPVDVQAATGATALAVGGRDQSCALKSGSLLCWGTNRDGQIGSGSMEQPSVPTAFGSLTGVKAGAAGSVVICAFDTKVRCAGFALSGVVGHGSFSGNQGMNQTVPAELAVPAGGVALTDVAKLSAGGGLFSCLSTTKDEIYCWGENARGQLGNDTSGNGASSAIPVKVLGLP